MRIFHFKHNLRLKLFFFLFTAKKVVEKQQLIQMNNHASEMNTRLDHTCHYCGKEFSHKKGLRKHIANKHEYTGIKVKNEIMEDDDFAFGGKYSAVLVNTND